MTRCSNHHRTTIAHFLNHGKWDENVWEGILKAAVIRRIYEESERSGKPVLCIVDDTIASKTRQNGPYSLLCRISSATAGIPAQK